MATTKAATTSILFLAAMGTLIRSHWVLATCIYNIPVYQSQGKECFRYDLSDLAKDETVYVRYDRFNNTYLISPPCTTIPLPDARCKNSSCPLLLPSSFYQLYPSNSGCISCGSPSSGKALPLNASDPQAGLLLRFTDGTTCPGTSTPRKSSYALICNQSASPSQGPDPLVQINTIDQYVITWQTPLACPTQAPITNCPTPPIPKPTSTQLSWQKLELGVIIHFNIATSAGTQGCDAPKAPPPISIFNPTAPNFTVSVVTVI